MKSKYFALKNLKSPGRVHIMHKGCVNLEDLPEEELEKMWKAGSSYIQLTIDGMEKYILGFKRIETKKLNFRKNRNKEEDSKLEE